MVQLVCYKACIQEAEELRSTGKGKMVLDKSTDHLWAYYLSLRWQEVLGRRGNKRITVHCLRTDKKLIAAVILRHIFYSVSVYFC